MNLKECLKTYYEFSRILSENVRKLAFAGIAVVWIFRQENQTLNFLPNLLKGALILLVLTLAMDLLHYMYQACLYCIYSHYKERKLKKNYPVDEYREVVFDLPKWFPIPATILFFIKNVFLVIGYICILIYLIK